MCKTEPRVLRVSSMPSSVTMWIDHTSHRETVYINAAEITEHQARILELALRTGAVRDLDAAITRMARHSAPPPRRSHER